jgi:hypothetical protein
MDIVNYLIPKTRNYIALLILKLYVYACQTFTTFITDRLYVRNFIQPVQAHMAKTAGPPDEGESVLPNMVIYCLQHFRNGVSEQAIMALAGLLPIPVITDKNRIAIIAKGTTCIAGTDNGCFSFRRQRHHMGRCKRA